MEVIRDEVIQEMFGLAFFTHRDREVAIEGVPSVGRRAFEKKVCIGR